MTAVHETQGGAVLSPTRRRIALMALALGGFGIGSALYAPGRAASDVAARARAFADAWHAHHVSKGTPA